MKSIIISSLLSLILTGNPVVFDASPPNNIVQTPYGTATKQYTANTNGDAVANIGPVTFAIPAPTSILKYTFNGVASGTFDIVIAPTLTNYYLFTRNCVLISVLQNGNMRFRVTNVDECEIVISHSGVYQQVIYSFENQNITIDDSLYSNVDDIMTYTESIDGYIQTINANTNTIKNILTQSLGSYVTQDGSLYTDMQTLINTLNDINDYGDIPYYSYQAYKMFGYIGTLTDFSFSGSSIYKSYNKAFKLKTIANSPYSASQVFEIRSGQTFHIVGFFSHNVTSQTIRLIDGSGNIYNMLPNTIFNINGMKLIDFYYKNTGSSSILPMIQPANDSMSEVIPIYCGMNIPAELAYDLNLDTDNILIRSINAVKNAVENMAINVNQLTVNATGITYNTTQQNVDNSVTTYNNNMEIVNNIENNFKTMFDTANQNYNVDNIPITEQFISTSSFMNNIATQLYGIDIIKYPITLLLLGIVLIGILG